MQQPRLPLAVAAGGPRTLQVAARYADAWITYGDTTYTDVSAEGTERVVARQAEVLEAHCNRLHRDPSTIDRIYLIGNTEAKPLVSLQAFEEFIGRYSELGFTDVVFHMPRHDDPVWNESPAIVDEIAEAGLLS